MEHHHLLQLSSPPPPPPAHLTMSPGFFDVGVAGSGDWVEELMRLGELFGVGVGGGEDGGGNAAAVVEDQVLCVWQECEGGGSPEQPSCGGEVSAPCGGEVACRDNDGENSATRKRRDRSKTIVSERKRRVRMKEKLYELRALVPNITKMDKASIIADAVVYVKDLQAHARKLREEVAVLESRPAATSPSAVRRQPRQPRGGRAAARANDDAESNGAPAAVTTTTAHGARVTHVGAARVGEGRFFVTVECEPVPGGGGGSVAAASLCAAVESLSCFKVESSTLGCSPDRVVSTLTFKVASEAEDDAAAISECTVKLWVMAALLKEGFRPQPTVQIS
ncbi:transcription factor BHLH156-like [Oryza brachyantha]|uniref:transcription factor BHLH156-like n=1 Tax=Oryza brachyantha TaxID=4533 RepID=UPI001AD9BF80|nr:transcription factor BHLH156-like [Oryza brachyantha]